MALTTQQQVSWQLALFSLFIMSVSTLLCQELVKYRGPGTKRLVDTEWVIPAGVVLPTLWVGGFVASINYLGAVSESSRNMALLYGVMALNGGLVYLSTKKQGASGTRPSYLSVLFWPMFLGLMLGSLMAVVPEMALSKACGAYHSGL
jgi:hypothetical protein